MTALPDHIDRIADIIVRIEDILDRLHDLGLDAEMQMPLNKENMELMARADQIRREDYAREEQGN